MLKLKFELVLHIVFNLGIWELVNSMTKNVLKLTPSKQFGHIHSSLEL